MGHLKFYNWSILQNKEELIPKLFEVKSENDIKIFEKKNQDF